MLVSTPGIRTSKSLRRNNNGPKFPGLIKRSQGLEAIGLTHQLIRQDKSWEDGYNCSLMESRVPTAWHSHHTSNQSFSETPLAGRPSGETSQATPSLPQSLTTSLAELNSLQLVVHRVNSMDPFYNRQSRLSKWLSLLSPLSCEVVCILVRGSTKYEPLVRSMK